MASLSSLFLLALLSLLSLTSVSSQVSSGYCFSYTFTGGNSAATQWTVTASGIISTSTSLSTAVRNQATITGISGTRTFYNASFSSTVSFTGITAAPNAFNASNVVFSQYPYTDTTGWSISTSGLVYYQNAVGSNTIHLWTSYDPLLEVSGSQTIYVGELKVIAQSTVAAVSACPANVTLPVFSSLQPYSFCWYIQSDSTAGTRPWTTYAYGVLTGSQPFEQEGRQAIQINSITGLRYFTIDGNTYWNRLTGVKNDIQDLSQWGIKNDNILYLSDPYLDQYGWLVTADSNLTYPSGVSASPDINFEYDQYATLQYIDLNADNTHYVQSSNQGFAYSAYTAGGTHAACKSQATTVLTPATTQWTFCYVFYGADAVNGMWQITSSGIITTYAQPVDTFSNKDAYPTPRPGYVAIGISGTRVWSNATLTITRNILGLVPDTQAFESKVFDNVIYASYPYVDGAGLSFYLDGPVVPQSLDQYGQVLVNASFVNIATSGYNPLKELPTGGEEGSLIIRPAASNANLPAQCAALAAGTTTQFSFCYYITGDKSSNDPAPSATWSISAWGVLTVTGPFEREGAANTYRITAATGQRSLTVTTAAGVTTTYNQTILRSQAPNADTNTYGFLSNMILYADGLPGVGAIPGDATKKTDEYGWILTLDSNAWYPSNNGAVQSAGPDINLCTDQFGTFQYYEQSVQQSALYFQSANAGLNVNPYISGSAALTCPYTPSTYIPGSSSLSGYCFSYTFTGGNSAATQWTVTAQGTISTSAPLSSSVRNQAAILGVSGTRTFYNASFSSTVSFTGITTSTTTAASNVVFSQYPYTDTTGWLISTSGPVYYQNAVGDRTIHLWQSYDPLLEVSGSQTIYVGELKVIAQSTVASVSACPANITLPVFSSLQPYSFCWYIQSDGSDAVSAAGRPWTTYAYGVLTGSQPFEQEGRQAIQINSITGLRYFTIDGNTSWNRLTGVKNDIQDLSQWGIKNDNIMYLSDPYLDQYGWLVTADSNLRYPSGVSASPDINFEYDQFASLQYIDLNADNNNYVQSSKQGFVYSAYTAGGTHAACKSQATSVLTPATTQWTFCYSIYGADATNGDWVIRASGTITTYAQSVNTTNTNDAYPAARQGYVVVGISGTRVWSNATLTSSRNILGVVPDTQVFSAKYPANNVIYASYPYVDAGGLSFYLDGPVFPQLVDAYGLVLNNASFVNIHANGVNPLKELPTGGEEGSLIIRPAASNADLPAQCASLVAGTTSQYSFCYYLTGDKSSNDPAPSASWTVSAWGAITVSGPFEREGVANTYRVTSIEGQRSVAVTTAAGVSTNITQNIAGIKGANGDINTYYFATNNILYPTGIPAVGAIPGSSNILVDLYGWLITLDGNVVYPSTNGTITSVGPDLDFATDQFGTNQYQDVSVYDTTNIVLQSSISGMSVKTYGGTGDVSGFACPNTPASYTPVSQSRSGGGGGGSGLSGGAIAGIVIGSVVGASLLLCVIVGALLFSGGRSRGGKGDAKRLGGGGSTDASSESSQVQHSQVELQDRHDTADAETSQAHV